MKDLYKNTWLRWALYGLTIWCGVLTFWTLANALTLFSVTFAALTLLLPLTIKRADEIARRAYVSLKIAKTVAPGELADRWAINTVKELKFVGQEKLRAQAEEEAREGYEALQFIARHFSIRKQQELQVLLERLVELNLVQWEKEDKVRLQRDWKAAVAARDNNTLRIEVKNLVNILFGSKLEHKLYQTRQVESL
tara:strand:- start:4713 stop:5297 length:585 start_codon:yes stop_codon:yes gene_type:complete